MTRHRFPFQFCTSSTRPVYTISREKAFAIPGGSTIPGEQILYKDIWTLQQFNIDISDSKSLEDFEELKTENLV
jgi:hypothetical protein